MTYDFHAHIWPCADHGSRSEEDTEAQLAILRASGVKQVVATPHFYPDNWHSAADFLAFRREREAMLRPLLAKTDLSVYAGAEVLLSEGIDRMEGLRELCIAGTNVLLLEMPFFRWNERLYQTVASLTCSGMCVLLAHIDRYPDRYAEDLFKCGYRGILDVSALVGLPNRRRRKKLLSWIDEGYVVGIGSNYEVKNRRLCKIIKKAADYVGIQINFQSDEKRLGKIIAKATAVIGEARLKKLAVSTKKALTGAVKITE